MAKHRSPREVRILADATSNATEASEAAEAAQEAAEEAQEAAETAAETAEDLATSGIKVLSTTVGHADLTDAVNGEAQSISMGTLPTNATILGHSLLVATPFSGGSVSEAKATIGRTADKDSILESLECITDQPTSAEKRAAIGVMSQGRYSGEEIFITITPDAGHALLALTAGSITGEVYFTVPAAP